MKTRTLVVLCVVTGAMMLAIQGLAKPEPDPKDIARQAESLSIPRLWQGRVAPAIELPMLDGETFRLADHIGHETVVLNFFATWCGPCKKEMPELQRYAQTLAGEPFLLVGIDVEEQRAVVERFIREMKTTFPIALDDTGRIARELRVTSFPTTIVVGADGRVKLYETGAILNADVSLTGVVKPELEAIAAGKRVSLDDYRASLKQQPPLPATDTADDDGTNLSGRARQIADAMGCPCGCDDKVSACGCGTSKRIKARLAKGEFGERTDEQIIRDLNAEFCMKGM